MRRNGRQQNLFGAERTPSKEITAASIRGLSILGIVVNPKKKEPVLAVTDGTYVGLRSLLEAHPLKREGVGYYDNDSDEPASVISEYPRCHTPSGVASKGQGYGTSLYTALTLGAYLTAEREIKIEMGIRGQGISSRTDNRSESADTWWAAAVKVGLAEELDGEEQKEEYVKLDVDADDLQSCLSGSGYDGQIVYVNEVNVDIERPGDSVEIYKYVEAFGKDLVVAEIILSEEIPEDLAQNAELDFLWKDLMEGPEYFLDTDKDSLLSLDVRGLDKRAMNIIAICYAVNGFKDPDIDALWYRWENRMDPSSQVRQQGLFTPNARAGALSDVLEARRLTDWDSIANLP